MLLLIPGVADSQNTLNFECDIMDRSHTVNASVSSVGGRRQQHSCSYDVAARGMTQKGDDMLKSVSVLFRARSSLC